MESEIYHKMAELEEQHWWFVSRRKIIETLVINKIRDLNHNSKILDVGCGTGGNLKLLSLPSKNLVGLEPDTVSAKIAATKSAKQVYLGSLPHEIPFSSNSFDLILLLDVLEHVDNDVESLRLLYSKLKPGGHIIITVPALKFLWSKHDESHHHKRRYLLKELLYKIENNNFKVSYASYFNFWLFPIISLIRVIKLNKLFKKNQSDLVLPSKFINRILTLIMSGEKYILKFLKLPIGVSIVVICQKQITK